MPDAAGADQTRYAPSTMNTTIAAIFSSENAYSTVPYSVTLARFTAISSAEKPITQYQPGTAGNQYFMNTAIALISVPIANTTANQYA